MTSSTVRFGDFYGKNFVLELDEMNTQNAFRPGEDTCYVRLFPGGQQPQLFTSMGSARIVASRLPFDVEEDIVFVKEDRQSLKYPCVMIKSWEWVGRTYPTPQFREEEIKLPQKLSGVLRVKYTAYYEKYY